VFFVGLLFLIVVLSWDSAGIFVSKMVLQLVSVDISPLIRLLRAELSGFYALLLIALYLEAGRENRVISLSPDQFSSVKKVMEEYISNVDSKKFIAKAIENAFDDKKAGRLADLLTPNKKVYYDCSVTLTLLQDVENLKSFLYQQTVDFFVREAFIIVAITNSTTAQDALFNIAGVDEVFCDKSVSSVNDEYLSHFIERSVFEETVVSDGGMLNQVPLKPIPLSRAKARSLKQSIPPELKDDVVFLQVSSTDLNSEKFRLQIKYPPSQFRKTIPYVYWISDRSLYLERIEIDASSFSSDSDESISIMPILSNFQSKINFDEIQCIDTPVTLRVESWICYGQGVILSWS